MLLINIEFKLKIKEVFMVITGISIGNKKVANSKKMSNKAPSPFEPINYPKVKSLTVFGDTFKSQAKQKSH